MDWNREKQFWRSAGRAFGGAVIFSFTLLMTMEMWWMGFYLNESKILIFVLANVPLLVGLSYYAGFRETGSWMEDVLDALVAYAIGLATVLVFLSAMAILTRYMSVQELVGRSILLSVPASLGAMLASKQFGQEVKADQERKRRSGYWGELFIMVVGAIVLAFSVAPTEEMLLIGLKMSSWHALSLMAISIVLMHALVYTVEFRGQEDSPPGLGFWGTFAIFTATGYALVTLTSAYLLWTFNRFEGVALLPAIKCTIVLAFPASLGAAISRIIV
ncbi:TIGR02587 family membrane protein [Proteobacteria bacterium 005FR1]|nr:TIGR02587 family membrane protein [Proteobacteria bacterium 005FR1]